MKSLQICGSLATALLLTACGSGQDEGGAAARPVGGETGTELAATQVLHIGNYGEPQTLDVHRGTGIPGSNIQRDLYEGLINEAPDGDLEPGAAESWTVSGDGTIYTFALRADGRWSNGDPVTAGDFVFSLRRGVDPATLSEYSFMLAPIENAEAITAGDLPPAALGVRAIDERTLEIRLQNATPYFLGLLTHPVSFPVHRPSLERYGERFTRPGNLVSNGAFMLADWVVQSHIKLVRNPNYWDDDNTVLDEVWFHVTEDLPAELSRFRAGELDITESIPKAQISWIRENMPDELTIAPYLGHYYYGFNVTRPPFKDNPALRRALALAIDRDIITRQVTNAGELPAYGWVPPVNGYDRQQMPEAGWAQAEREAEARRLYAEAGYSREHPLEVEILYNTHEDHKRIALAIAGMWKQVLGVETSLLNQEWKVFLDSRSRKIDTQIFRGGWIGDYNDANTYAELMVSTSGLNNTGYSNPRYDDLVRRAAAERDLERRAELLQQAETVLLEDMPVLPIYFYVTARMVRPWVGGYTSNIMDHHRHKNFYILKH